MKLSRLERANEIEFRNWLSEKLTLTSYQKSKMREDEIIRFSDFYIYKEREAVKTSVLWRLTLPLFPTPDYQKNQLMRKHKISWTESTWNPYIGCSKVSEGCKNCYAIRMAYRLAHMPATKEFYGPTVEKTKGGKLNWTGKIVENKTQFDKPLRTKKPTIFFVNSMSDLFHEDLTFEQIHRVFVIMALCPQHTFQILTKRPERAKQYFERYDDGLGDMHELESAVMPYNHMLYCKDKNTLLPALKESGWMWDTTYSDDGKDSMLIFENEGPLKNVWLGVSVENQKHADERIPLLLRIPAAVRFLSCEPLLGEVDLKNLNGPAGSRYQVLEPITNCGDSNRAAIDWVICGGESGPDSRPMHPDWVRKLRDQCNRAHVPFLFKQWGSWLPYQVTSNSVANSQNVDSINPTTLGIFKDELFPKKYTDSYKLNHSGGFCTYKNVGKHASGNLLDGVQHTGMPNR